MDGSCAYQETVVFLSELCPLLTFVHWRHWLVLEVWFCERTSLGCVAGRLNSEPRGRKALKPMS